MTLIIGIQLKDSVIIAADRRLTHQTDDLKFSIVSDSYKKIAYLEHIVFSGSGDALIIRRLKDELLDKTTSEMLSNSFFKEIQRRKTEIGEHEQIGKTKLFFSSRKNNRLILKICSTDQVGNIYSNIVEPMTIELTMRPENISKLSHLLVDFHAKLKNIEDFQNQEEWLNFYVEKLRKIFHLCSSFDETVSSSFDICAHTACGIFYDCCD
ncbi:hypothetical protein [Acinetobacter sp. DSM 11652]|uniref:hypothetical protein n=1 Tax=Acinetobacter sp. DSM 11652 TaxID=346222 RepID=UPI0008C71D45|nr:hypothetical protein [Acinetobacter sp. DSM 11652]SEL57905.1 hypothetical protein SAMN05216500_103212 [Acinetobacter sp. DSM 11652]